MNPMRLAVLGIGAVVAALFGPASVGWASSDDARDSWLMTVEPLDVPPAAIAHHGFDTRLRGLCRTLQSTPIESIADALGDDATPHPSRNAVDVVSFVGELTRPLPDESYPSELSALTELPVGIPPDPIRVGAAIRALAVLRTTCFTLHDFTRAREGDAAIIRELFGGERTRVVAALLDGLVRNRRAIEAAVSGVERAEASGAGLDSARATLFEEVARGLAGQESGTSAGSPGSGFLGGQPRSLIDGLAGFLIDRAKRESLDFARERLMHELCIAGTRPYLRETCELLARMQHDLALRALGKSLRAAVERDLSRFPDVAVSDWATREGGDGRVAALVRLALAGFRAAHAGVDPLNLVAGIHVADRFDCERSGFAVPGIDECRQSLALSREVSALIHAMQQLDGRGRDRLWFASVMVSWASRRARMPHGASEHWMIHPDSLEGLSTIAGELVTIRNLVKAAQKAAERGALDLDGSQDLLLAARNSIRVLLRTPRFFVEVPIQSTAEATAAVARSPRPLQRPQSVGDTGRARDRVETYARLVAAATDADWSRAVPATLRILAELGIDLELRAETRALVRHAPVLVEIASARSSADVVATLDAAVPVGGYRAKFREPVFSITGVIGWHIGGERYRSSSGPVTAGSFAMFAALGPELSWPLPSKRTKAWSVGLLATVVDLGSVTARQFGSDEDQASAEAMPPLDWRTLASPGMYLKVGVAQSPFCFGVGASYNPYLRAAQMSDEVWGGLRFGLFAGVDVTLWSVRLRRATRTTIASSR